MLKSSILKDAQLKQVGQGINKVVTILTNMSKTQLGIWTGGVLLGAGFFEAYSHDVKMKAQVEIDKAKKTQIEQFVKEKIKRRSYQLKSLC